MLQVGKGGPLLEGRVNRSTANKNGTARIRAKGLKRWFWDHFDVGDYVDVEFTRDAVIILSRHS
jgi:hypothetical protein